MAKLEDPGKALVKGKAPTPEEAKAARLAAWKKPTKKADRDKLRAERIAGYEAVHGRRP